MRYMIIFAIGPVQDFIATARRSRDLWYGSWMLSELSKTVAKTLGEKYGLHSLIFPAPRDMKKLGENNNASIANKIVAIIDTLPEEIAQQIQEAVTKRLNALRDEAYSHIRGSYDRSLAERQVKDLVEFYWVAVEYPDVTKYVETRNRIEALLAVRKNTRNFKQFDGEPKPKSSLDGAREAVIPEETYPKKWEDEKTRAKKIKSLYDCYNARRSERLSGIDLIKRLGGKSLERKFPNTSQTQASEEVTEEIEAIEEGGENLEPDFPSTSHVAALPFLKKVDEDENTDSSEAMLKEAKALFKEFELEPTDDASLLYASRISDWLPEGKQQEQLLEKLEVILEKYAGASSHPSPYYALMMADGDGMGKTIDALKNAEAHRSFSQALSDFSGHVRNTVPDFEGFPIYAGGDDILAYLPMHQALPCAKQLEGDFKKEMGKYNYKDSDEIIYPALSTGIIIAHHLTPLSDVLELTRKAEKEAKKVPGKNALVITVSKRSGVPRTIKGKWGQLDKRLEKMIEFSNQGAISKGTAYELRELSRTLSGSDELKDALVQEALRIVERKRESGSDEKFSQKIINAFQVWLEDKNAPVPVNELARELIVAEMFAGTWQAEEEKEV